MNLTTLTLVFPNTKVSRSDYLKPRCEKYVVGTASASHLASSCELFSFVCYRSMLLGSPNTIGKAFLDPGRIHLLKEPLHPQPLAHEEGVEESHFSKRYFLFFRLQTGNGRWTNRKLFGFRRSDLQHDAEWLRYRPQQVLLDPKTRRPSTFADAEDFEAKNGFFGPNNARLTREQAWSTFFWLLLRHTFYVGSRATRGGQKECLPWATDDLAAIYRGSNLVKKGF
ncbi:MAG: hypothetical protein K2X38_07875 [Gemmataceae bacterium]|nr:hypothetical protein [Gemmataceae bacterium]